ncbi:threonine/homoserine/homoserine lactone efflux protein [Solirubrobacter pauli]|uniref:Threonine/homoserine/homoserine lactone efflux protein n=1 Tax=Solirubrobacter pauli TaxID=166793 RepID=A0A660L8T8_9ACTN|nr:LysE family translocator [Solirubrobacter pauli]RKQ87980.1 threonine/homoserine/homoserine lactone efflux protein [Solirubrobacter pauli]
MPSASTLALFALAALALIAIPGPNMIYIATRSMSEGRSAGFASALGLLTGTGINVLAAAAGLSALIASSDVAYDVIRYAGAAYLVYLGIKALRSHGAHAEAAAPRGSAYRQAIVVQLLNPKVTLFFLAFLPQFVDPQAGPVWTQVLVLGAVLGALGFVMDCGYALAASSAARKLNGFRHGNRITGAVYLALGAAAALTGGRR